MKNYFAFVLFSICISFSIVRAQSNFVGSGVTLQFNNSPGNYINIGDVFNSLTFPFTYEAWLNPSSFPSVWGGIIGSDNDASAYYGFWIRTSTSNKVQVEFGNALGSGSQFRRGYITTESISLNKWTHVSVVCNSVTDVHIYFNGVEQSKISSGGTSTSTLLTHSSAAGSFGNQFNIFSDQVYIGQLDEIRLWNISRSQDDIRNFMCRKVDPSSSGLIGYWTADESYTSNTLNDITTPSENGTVVGSVGKITSGAPIGDESEYNYTSNWSGVTVSENDLSGDQVTASNITGSPYGVHVYLVKSFPYDIDGLGSTPPFYFGVFCASASSTPQYDITYHYDFGDGAINSGNESTANLFRRNDASVTTWINSSGTLDTIVNSVTKNIESNRGEYILDVNPCVCSAPVIISVDSICGNLASMCWSSVECATEYLVRWNILPDPTWIYESIAAPDTCRQFTSKFGDVNEIEIASVCENGDTSDFSQTYTYTGYLVCTPPTDQATSNITATSATFSWTASPDADKYKVLYRHASVINTKTTSNTSVTVSGLEPNATYKWKVKARCTYCDHKNWGPYTDFQNFTTLTQRQYLLTKEQSSMKLYPNPANNIFSIDFNLGYSTNESYSLEVQNIFGQLLMTDKGSLSAGGVTKKISLDSRISDGLYMVVIIVGGQEYRQQLVISND